MLTVATDTREESNVSYSYRSKRLVQIVQNQHARVPDLSHFACDTQALRPRRSMN